MSDALRIGKYLTAVEHQTTRKTRLWEVLGNRGDRLGMIGWYGPWRQYTFDPSTGTTFNRDCLIDLSNFLRRVNDEHRSAARRGLGRG